MDASSGADGEAGVDGTDGTDGSDAGRAVDALEVADLVGGPDAFVRLVDDFYVRVEADPLLRPLYPEDLAPGKRHLALFLAQYFGAGPVYEVERGHPRLRMRHAAFPIPPERALAWAEHMAAAVRSQRFPHEAEAVILSYVARATPSLVNALPIEVAGDGAGVEGPTLTP